jgi:nucleoid-associated protein YgaU
MYKTKKESRSAGTETAKIMDEVFGTNPHNDYITAKNKKQVLYIIFFAIITLIFTFWVFAGPNTTINLVPIEHKVTYGDTLWSIAKEYKPDNMTMDTYMAWVYEHNDGGMIYPGDTVIMAEVVE